MSPIVFARCIAAAAIGTLVACASSPSGGTTPANATGALVRFVDVSPDAGVPAPANPSNELLLFQTASANVTIDGVVVAAVPGDSLPPSLLTGVPQQLVSMTPYVVLSAGPHSIAFTDPSAYTAQGYLAITGGLPAFKDGARYTVVLEGSYCLGTLRIVTFNDDTPTTQGLAVYGVAPSSTQTSFDVGLVPSTTLGNVRNGQRASLALPQSSGIDVYTAIGSMRSTLLPSSLDGYDTNNAVPFNDLTAISIFIRDGVPTPSNGSCPKTPAAPVIQGALTN